MDRKEEIRTYLEKKIAEFSSFGKFRDSRDRFFAVVEAFETELISVLRKSKIVATDRITDLKDLFDQLVPQRTKSQGPNGVYWPGVNPIFEQIQVELVRMEKDLEKAHVSWRLRIRDWIAANWRWVLKLAVPIIVAVLIKKLFGWPGILLLRNDLGVDTGFAFSCLSPFKSVPFRVIFEVLRPAFPARDL